jgi:hypothetical protein
MTLALGPSPSALYSPRQIALAAFLGSPLAAGWFFRQNFLTLADEQRAIRSMWVGGGCTVLVLAIGFALPRHFPNALLPALYTAAIHQYASVSFGTPFKKHISEGGPKGSWWAVVGVSIGALLLLLLFLFAAGIALYLAMPSLFPK